MLSAMLRLSASAAAFGRVATLGAGRSRWRSPWPRGMAGGTEAPLRGTPGSLLAAGLSARDPPVCCDGRLQAVQSRLCNVLHAGVGRIGL